VANDAEIVADEQERQPRSRRRVASRLTTCAWIDTSSAAVASSQTSTFGRTPNARAMPMRARCPPENWCGKRSRTEGSSPTSRIRRATSASTGAGRNDLVDGDRLADDGARAHAGIERAHRILKDHLDGEIGATALGAAQGRPVAPILPHDAVRRLENARHDAGERGLAAAGFAHEPQHLPGPDRQRHVLDRMDDLRASSRPQPVRDRFGRVQGCDEALGDALQFDEVAHAASAASSG
jgi:hypothetical protein